MFGGGSERVRRPPCSVFLPPASRTRPPPLALLLLLAEGVEAELWPSVVFFSSAPAFRFSRVFGTRYVLSPVLPCPPESCGA